MYKMSDEEFFKVYGRMPRRNNNKNKKKKVKVYWSRIVVALIVVILLVVGIVKLASGKSKKGGAQNGKASVSSSAGKNDDYYAAPENKETDVVYDGIELTVCIDAAHGGVDKGAVGEDGGGCARGDLLRAGGVAVVLHRDVERAVELVHGHDLGVDGRGVVLDALGLLVGHGDLGLGDGVDEATGCAAVRARGALVVVARHVL